MRSVVSSSISSVILTGGVSAFLISSGDNLNKHKSKFNTIGSDNAGGNGHLSKAQRKKLNKENKKRV